MRKRGEGGLGATMLVVAVLIAGVATTGLTGQDMDRRQPPTRTIACWLDEPEVVNPHERRDPKPLGELPEGLRQRTVTQSTVLLKLCVGVDGVVERVVVRHSSGSKEIDAHYASILSSWEFPPLQRASGAVRSVVPVAIVIHR